MSFVLLAANLVLLPFNFFVSSSGEGSRNPLANISLHVLLVLTHYRKCVMADGSITNKNEDDAISDSLLKASSDFIENPNCRALNNARDIECKFTGSLFFLMEDGSFTDHHQLLCKRTCS